MALFNLWQRRQRIIVVARETRDEEKEGEEMTFFHSSLGLCLQGSKTGVRAQTETTAARNEGAGAFPLLLLLFLLLYLRLPANEIAFLRSSDLVSILEAKRWRDGKKRACGGREKKRERRRPATPLALAATTNPH